MALSKTHNSRHQLQAIDRPTSFVRPSVTRLGHSHGSGRSCLLSEYVQREILIENCLWLHRSLLAPVAFLRPASSFLSYWSFSIDYPIRNIINKRHVCVRSSLDIINLVNLLSFTRKVIHSHIANLRIKFSVYNYAERCIPLFSRCYQEQGRREIAPIKR